MNKLRFFSLMLAVIFSLNLSARDFFVAPNGSDQNPGTKMQPLASLNGARDLIRKLRSSGQLNSEVNVIVANGTYYITEPLLLTTLDSGTEDFPVTYRAEEGASPVFNGGIPIKNWEKVSDKIWKANVDEVTRYGFYFEQLYIDGQRATRAKSPNQGFYYLKDVEETVVSRGTGRVPAVATQKLKVFPDAAGDFDKFTKSDFNDAVLTLHHKWDNTRKRIFFFDSDSSEIFISGKGMKPWNSLNKKTRYVIENTRAALDTLGEWYLERNGDLFYIPAEGKNPNQMAI
ncbi:MAG: hypothetical protein LC658_04530, partial [Bacteroidales bacterium]|nr:hypothetical protein [Bacteroidales bacterium]